MDIQARGLYELHCVQLFTSNVMTHAYNEDKSVSVKYPGGTEDRREA